MSRIIASLLAVTFLVWERECPNAQLKEIKERKGRRRQRVVGTEAHFLDSEAIISLSEDIKDSLKILQFPREAPAATRQRESVK